MVQLPECPHSVCKECFKDHFTNVIKTQNVKDFSCPICAQPHISASDDVYFARLMALVSLLFIVRIGKNSA